MRGPRIWKLEAEPGAARLARGHVTDFCGDAGCHDLADDATVIVTELVSNAVIHAMTTSELRVSYGAGVLRIEVMDAAPHRPVMRSPGTTEEHGRGLLLVSTLSESWGVEPQPDGKLVWAELRP